MKTSSFSCFRRRFAMTLCAALLATGTALPASADTLEKIRSSGVLAIGNGGIYPPFEFRENGELVGFDIDLGNELARRMGVKPDWRVTDYVGVVGMLTSGRADILVTALGNTPERASRIAFSDAYYLLGDAAAYREDVQMNTLDDLKGKIVGVQSGTPADKLVREKYGDVVKEVRVYNSLPLALKDLEVGRTEVVINSEPVLRYHLSRQPDSKIKVSPAWEHTEAGVNTRLDDTNLMAEINRHLKDMRADGFLDELNRKWFGAS